MWKYNSSDELYHYGVLGMKWGVRRSDRKTYGMSERQVKKAIRNSSGEAVNKVNEKHSKELLSNETYKKLGQKSNELVKAYMKSDEADFEKADGGDYNPSKKSMDLWKQISDVDKQMREIEVSISKKYIHQYNDARLSDIKYSGSVEKGREMLKKYNKEYTVRSYDGFIKDGRFGGIWASPDDAPYLRPTNI